MKNLNKNYIVFGSILGISLIISFIIGSITVYKLRSNDTLTSTGSAKESVTSDKVKWTSSITRPVTASTMGTGYTRMDSDLKAVKGFLTENDITPESIDVSPIFMNEVYDQNQGMDKRYNLVQNITVQSDDVNKVNALAKNTNSLIIDKGVLFSTNSLEFYYSKLPEARVDLLAAAVDDAKARVGQLAKAGGRKIGSLQSASSGVVQVMSPNSREVSDYGTYDTSSIDKEIMVTVKATFAIK